MSSTWTRRALLWRGFSASALGLLPIPAFAQGDGQSEPAAAVWLEQALAIKSLGAPLRLSRFVEPIYYVLAPGIAWKPNPDNGPQYSAVTVPEGFITDLASIPPLLFPILRADGEYAQAAIVHDYLYWTQRTTRDYADEVFRTAMRDLEVKPAEIQSIFAAVRLFGQSAWDRNGELKKSGERRFLKGFPTEARTRWAEWKRNPDHFHVDDL